MLKVTSAVVLAGALVLSQAGTLAATGNSGVPPISRDPGIAPYDHMIGTFRLDRTRSDDPQRVADLAVRRLPAGERDRVLRLVQNRLEPPDTISIDRRDSRVILASSRGPRVEFEADGRSHVEDTAGGRTRTTRASLSGDILEVTTTGGPNTDFSASFAPLDNGQALRVTRRISDDVLPSPISIQSVYRKTSDVPEWDVYGPNRRDPANEPESGSVLVPDGMVLSATLNQSLDLRTARRGDRVVLTVQDSSRREFDGATIEGYVTGTSTSDRTALALEFDQIRLRNGRSSEFAGTIESVRGPNGETYAVDRADESSPDRTDQAVKRGTIGAAVGAIIGAIAGGAKGAAIGAVIGGAGGAGTVLIDNKTGRTDLPRGTEFSIRARTN